MRVYFTLLSWGAGTSNVQCLFGNDGRLLLSRSGMVSTQRECKKKVLTEAKTTNPVMAYFFFLALITAFPFLTGPLGSGFYELSIR